MTTKRGNGSRITVRLGVADQAKLAALKERTGKDNADIIRSLLAGENGTKSSGTDDTSAVISRLNSLESMLSDLVDHVVQNHGKSLPLEEQIRVANDASFSASWARFAVSFQVGDNKAAWDKFIAANPIQILKLDDQKEN